MPLVGDDIQHRRGPELPGPADPVPCDDDDDAGRRSVSRRLDLAQSAGHAAAAAAVQAGSPTAADDAPMDERDGADDEADRDFRASAFATVGERTADQ